MKELIEIQAKLKAPKNQFNSFGKYNYRSLEDIMEGLKPLLKEYGCFLIVSDEIVLIGERYYVKATAKIKNEKESISVSAFAREEDSKKGMDSSQLTGSTSSYARKYALNGLFAIDDTKDADSMDNTKTVKQEAKNSKQWLNRNTEQWNEAVKYLKGAGTIDKIKDKYNISKENEEKLKRGGFVMDNAMNLVTVMPVTKIERKEFIEQIKKEWLSGIYNPLEIEIYFKAVEDMIKEIRKDVEIKQYVLDEAEKHGKTFDFKGCVITQSNKTTYDYSSCEDEVLKDLKEKEAKIKNEIKIREAFLKSINEPVASVSNGEIIYPATKKQSSYLMIKYNS